MDFVIVHFIKMIDIKLSINSNRSVSQQRVMRLGRILHVTIVWLVIGRRGAIDSRQILVDLPEYCERKMSLWEWSKSLEGNDTIEDTSP